MTTSVKSLGIDRLSVEERLQLVEEIWDSIADSVVVLEVPQSHKDELDRRLETLKNDPTAGSSWEDVKARLRTKPSDASWLSGRRRRPTLRMPGIGANDRNSG